MYSPKRFFAAALILPFLYAAAWAQPGSGSGDVGWGRHGRYQGLFNPKTVETSRGQVVAVDTFSIGHGGRPGLHLKLKRSKDTIAVHLGPVWYLENQDASFATNDSVTVTGSKVTFDGKPAIIASEVAKGPEVLTLRDPKGMPFWSGWKRRQPK